MLITAAKKEKIEDGGPFSALYHYQVIKHSIKVNCVSPNLLYNLKLYLSSVCTAVMIILLFF